MTSLKKLLKRARANPRATVALCGAWPRSPGSPCWASRRDATATRAERRRCWPSKAPEAWLANQRSVSDFLKAADNGQLASVALANAHPGLVLYTLKNGEKGSATVPGCTALGCAGTPLDKLAERSAAGGFTLVGVDVDPRTKSAARQLLDVAVGAVLSPLMLVATLGFGFVHDLMRACRPSA